MAGWTEAAWCWGPRASRQQEWELGRGGKGGSQWYIQMLTDPEAGEGARKPRDPGGGGACPRPRGPGVPRLWQRVEPLEGMWGLRTGLLLRVGVCNLGEARGVTVGLGCPWPCRGMDLPGQVGSAWAHYLAMVIPSPPEGVSGPVPGTG